MHRVGLVDRRLLMMSRRRERRRTKGRNLRQAGRGKWNRLLGYHALRWIVRTRDRLVIMPTRPAAPLTYRVRALPSPSRRLRHQPRPSRRNPSLSIRRHLTRIPIPIPRLVFPLRLKAQALPNTVHARHLTRKHLPLHQPPSLEVIITLNPLPTFPRHPQALVHQPNQPSA